MDLQIFVLSEMHAFNCNLGLPQELFHMLYHGSFLMFLLHIH